MSVSIEDVITPVTLAQAKQSIYEVCEDLDLPTTAWKPTAVVRAIIWVVAAIIAGTSTVVSSIARMALRTYATGQYLTIHAKQWADIDRIEATFATGEVTLTNAGGGLFNVAAGDMTVQNSSTGKTYRNDSAFTLLPSGTATVAITATESGSASTSSAGQVDTIVTTMLGVTCSNAASVVGLDAESDDALKLREDQAIDAISPNGAAGAYAAVAIAATGANGDLIGVNRVRVNASSSTGEVTVTVATASGAVTGTAGNPATDLGAVNLAIQTTCVPLGIASCTVQSASAKTIAVTYTVWIYTTAGLTEAQVKTYAEAALTKYISTRPIAGDVIAPATTGYVYKNLLEATIKGMKSDLLDDATAKSISDQILKVTVSLPASDTALTATEVAVTGALTGTVHLEAP